MLVLASFTQFPYRQASYTHSHTGMLVMASSYMHSHTGMLMLASSSHAFPYRHAGAIRCGGGHGQALFIYLKLHASHSLIHSSSCRYAGVCGCRGGSDAMTVKFTCFMYTHVCFSCRHAGVCRCGSGAAGRHREVHRTVFLYRPGGALSGARAQARFAIMYVCV
jgi:hypothetical protein